MLRRGGVADVVHTRWAEYPDCYAHRLQQNFAGVAQSFGASREYGLSRTHVGAVRDVGVDASVSAALGRRAANGGGADQGGIAELRAAADSVGTLLTTQTCAGFLLTLVSIHLVPELVERLGWRSGFTILALGPALGCVAMWKLRLHPDA
jgi:hypothetical protein